MRGKNLIQLIQGIALISRPQGATKKQLSEELDVSLRTVARLIETMQELGFPLFDEREQLEREKCWKFEKSYLLKLPNIKLPDLSISLPEIISLYLLKGESNIFSGTEINKHIDTVFSKFDLCMPVQTQIYLKKLKKVFILKTESVKKYSDKEDFLHILIEAIIDMVICKIKYHSYSKDKIKQYNISPLHLFENKGGLYFFAVDTRVEKIKTFALERVHKISRTVNNFNYPEKFSPHEKLNSAFDIIFDEPVKVKVWFASKIARYIKERRWTMDQKIIENNDGSIIFKMNTSGWGDIKRWIMSYGVDAKIIEPIKMKVEIEKEIKKMAENIFLK